MILTYKDRGRFTSFYWATLPTECWLWLSQRHNQGYGEFFLNGQKVLAHRVAYLIEHGPFDEELQVLHTCDNPPCVNPKHLFLGTQVDNMQDMLSKGRSGLTKINDDDVKELRQLSKSGYTGVSLAYIFGLSTAQVSHILSGKQRKQA